MGGGRRRRVRGDVIERDGKKEKKKKKKKKKEIKKGKRTLETGVHLHIMRRYGRDRISRGVSSHRRDSSLLRCEKLPAGKVKPLLPLPQREPNPF